MCNYKKRTIMNDKEREYKEWQVAVEKTKTQNAVLLFDFEEWLKSKNLKPKTIKKHIHNIDFFINHYLLRYIVIPAEKGSFEIGEFLGDYFIRKAAWASKNSIKEYVSSFKKFYTFLVEIEKMDIEDLQEMYECINEDKENWIEEAENYTNDIEGDW